MAAGALLNSVRVATATTGTGTVTLGAAEAGYLSFSEAGAVNGTVYSYRLDDGNDFEIGRGTYSSAGPTLSRDTVLVSKISGTAGTTKLSLSGNAKLSIISTAEDHATTVLTTTGDLLTRDAGGLARLGLGSSGQVLGSTGSAVAWQNGGLILLNSGTLGSAQATIDMVLPNGYRGFRLAAQLRPVTNFANLWLRTSSNGGSSFNSGATDYDYTGVTVFFDDAAEAVPFGSVGASAIDIGSEVGNAAAAGVQSVVEVWDNAGPANKAFHFISGVHEGEGGFFHINGMGRRVSTATVNALRLLFDTGNVASGSKWALYGYV